jgi:hypothetical protein
MAAATDKRLANARKIPRRFSSSALSMGRF